MKRPPIDQLVTFLYCGDLAASHAFYHGLLGLPLVLDQGLCRIYQAGGDAFLGFCRQTANLAATRPAGVILTLVVDNSATVDEWGEYLVEQGAAAAIEKPPQLNPAFNIYHLFLRDPDGYLVEIQTFLDPAWPKHD